MEINPTGKNKSNNPSNLKKTITALRSSFDGIKVLIKAYEKFCKIEKLITNIIPATVLSKPGFIKIEAGNIRRKADINDFNRGIMFTATNFFIPSPGIMYTYILFNSAAIAEIPLKIQVI